MTGHDFTVTYSGNFVRVECECGEYVGDWHHKDMQALQRRMNSDISQHLHLVRRGLA